MKKRYTLPAITADGQYTSIGVEIEDDTKLREWLCDVSVRSNIVIDNFKFRWAVNPNLTVYPWIGAFAAIYNRDGIYIEGRLFYKDCYRDVLYPIGRILRMISKSARPSLGWCITVKV